jgi:hypothetical protein
MARLRVILPQCSKKLAGRGRTMAFVMLHRDSLS